MAVAVRPAPADVLACPVCRNALQSTASASQLQCAHCGRLYGVINGVPILLSSEAQQAIGQALSEQYTARFAKSRTSLLGRIASLISPPPPMLNTGARRGYRQLRKLLDARTPEPRLLVVGCGERPGEGMRALGKQLLAECVNLDIGPFPIVNVVGTGDELPFLADSFDAVAIQAVLEHVPYPRKVVSEIHRVLKPGGYVYAEIPFLQAFHAGPGDYQRYTVNGIRVLFDDFTPVFAGVCCGPTSAVTNVLVNYGAVALSFGSGLLYKVLWRLFGWIAFPFKYLDLLFANLPNAHIVASGVSFLGQKTEHHQQVWP
jgi:SAM-dependent methyltransferase